MTQLKKLIFLLLLTATFCFSGQALAGFTNGTILQEPGNNALYYVINGYATHIPSLKVFQCMQLGTHQKVTVTREQLQAMPKTAFLIKGDNGKIYRVDGEQRRHVPNMNTFKRLGFNDAEIIHLPPSTIGCIPKGPALR